MSISKALTSSRLGIGALEGQVEWFQHQERRIGINVGVHQHIHGREGGSDPSWIIRLRCIGQAIGRVSMGLWPVDTMKQKISLFC